MFLAKGNDVVFMQLAYERTKTSSIASQILAKISSISPKPLILRNLPCFS